MSRDREAFSGVMGEVLPSQLYSVRKASGKATVVVTRIKLRSADCRCKTCPNFVRQTVLLPRESLRSKSARHCTFKHKQLLGINLGQFRVLSGFELALRFCVEGLNVKPRWVLETVVTHGRMHPCMTRLGKLTSSDHCRSDTHRLRGTTGQN